MPGYIANVLQKYNHPSPTTPEFSPFTCPPTTYGASHIKPLTDCTVPLVSTAKQKRIQQVIGSLLFYARAVDPTPLPTLNDLAAEQTQATIKTDKAVSKLLDYMSTFPNAAIHYSASDMVLHIDSDVSYLSLPHARSRATGHYFLSNKSTSPHLPPPTPPTPNGPIYTLCKRMRNVFASATESEIAALFHNGQEATVLRTTLLEMKHPQPPTPIKTDNSTASGIANKTVIPRKNKIDGHEI